MLAPLASVVDLQEIVGERPAVSLSRTWELAEGGGLLRAAAPAGSAVTVDEGERALPGVVGRRLELRVVAVEEAVRRALEGHDLVLDSGLGQRGVERRVVGGGDVLVGAGLEAPGSAP